MSLKPAMWRRSFTVANAIVAFGSAAYVPISLNVSGQPLAAEICALVEVQGHTYGSSTPVPIRTNSYTFKVRCVVSATRWFMENHAPRNSILYFYCDGTNTYSTFEYTRDYDPTTAPSLQKHLGFVNGRVAGALPILTVIPSLHPLEDMGVNAPWMAYCSSGFLAQRARLMPLPGPWHIRHSLYALGYTDETTLFEDALALPCSLDLYSSMSLMRQSPHRSLLIRDEQMTPVRAPFLTPVPFGDHELHCRYRVLQTTNLSGCQIPLQFRLELLPHQSEGQRVGGTVVGRTERVTQVAKVPEFAPPRGGAAITDLRVRDPATLVDAVVYGLTNETIPAPNDARIIRALAEMRLSAAVDPVPTIRRHMIAFYIMVTGVIVFSAVSFYKQRCISGRKSRRVDTNRTYI